MGASAGWQDFDPKKQQGWQDVSSEAAAGKETEFEKERSPEKRQGGIRALGRDLLGFLTPSAQNPYPGMGVEQKQQAAEQSATDDTRRKSAGYSPVYRAVAPVAQSVGLNVNGMERAAEVGDESGVYGHAVAPIAAYGLARGTGAAANSRVGRAAGAGIVRGAKAAMPEFISRPVREGIAGARESWQASAPKQGMDALSAAVPPEVDALSQAASRREAIAPVEPPTITRPAMNKRPLARAEVVDDMGVNQEIQQRVNAEDVNALRDEGREYRDRNSPAVPKWKQIAEIRAQLAAEAVMKEAEAAQAIPARYTKTRPAKPAATERPYPPAATADEDLLPKLEESLRQARAKKAPPKAGK